MTNGSTNPSRNRHTIGLKVGLLAIFLGLGFGKDICAQTSSKSPSPKAQPLPPFQPIPLPSPIPSPSPSPAPGPINDFDFSAGIALPQGPYSKMPSTLAGALAMPLTERTKWGPVVRLTTGIAKEDVNFAATGYTETRSYKVTSNFVGAGLKISMDPRIALIAQGGLCYTESVLTGVETTAPLGSSLAIGDKRSVMDVGYSAAGRYEYPWRKFTFGGELGYLATASSEATAYRGVYLAAVITYTPDRVLPSPLPTPTAVPSPLASLEPSPVSKKTESAPK